MNHNYYNAEGYPDPTAFEALRNVESFQVDHPSGYVRINPDTFFPCTMEKARKLFRLVHRYCSRSQQEELLTIMLGRAHSLVIRAIQLDTRLGELDPLSEDFQNILKDLKHTRADHSRMRRIIRAYTIKGA